MSEENTNSNNAVDTSFNDDAVNNEVATSLISSLADYPASSDEIDCNIQKFKEQFQAKCNVLSELTKRNETMMEDLAKLHKEIEDLELKTKKIVENKNIFESEISQNFYDLKHIRETANIHCSNQEMLFSQSKDDLEHYSKEFKIHVESYFMRNGFQIYFNEIESIPVDASFTTKLDHPADLSDKSVYWIKLGIDDLKFHMDSASHDIDLTYLLADLNQTFDWRSFLILCKKKFKQFHSKNEDTKQED